MSARISLAAAALGLWACQFDGSGLGPGDGGVDPPDPDGGSDARADAGPCPADLHVELRIDGRDEPLGSGLPYVNVLVGDTVELSAAGSCSRAGAVELQWQVSPIDDTRHTALPDLEAETLTVYPVAAQPYNVSLTVSDGVNEPVQRQVFGFRAHAWESLDGLPNNDLRGLSSGDDILWIAGKAGAYQLSLQTPNNGFFAINDSTVGDDIENELQAVYHDTDADLVWFGHKDSRSWVWRLDRNVAPGVVDRIAFDSQTALGEAAEVEAFGQLADGLAVATTEGVTWSLDGVGFEGKFVPDEDPGVYAVAMGNGRQWTGGAALYDMDAAGNPVDVFDGRLDGDQKIRALAVDADAGELWAGTDNNGLARYDHVDDSPIAVYDSDTEGLDASKVRDLAVETTGRHAGDLWVATDKGVARFKRDRGVWLTMGNGLGLNGMLDVRAVIVDEDGGRRGVWAATNKGLVYLRAP